MKKPRARERAAYWVIVNHDGFAVEVRNWKWSAMSCKRNLTGGPYRILRVRVVEQAKGRGEKR